MKIVLFALAMTFAGNLFAQVISTNCQGTLIDSVSMDFNNTVSCNEDPGDGDLYVYLINGYFYPVPGRSYKARYSIYSGNQLLQSEIEDLGTPVGQVVVTQYLDFEGKNPNATSASVEIYENNKYLCTDVVQIPSDPRYFRK